ncbi:PREDICTED: uncharacterized protein LOC106330972 [Brassica oleracea var. oleracea]|uniref:uncharacterized protein LOC106330972 n=1 Tax=Brassica oleracea var. oleracea TaxID=109376 RepID=UPI0006A6E530|nr:PREDICTED: uncharacterized protein LOC106330972 [Brassica oleracea var. oleracea]
MPPKKSTDAPNNGDLSEFRKDLLAMQESFQATMHASFIEMGAMLADRLARVNPLFEDADTEGDGSDDTNPFARHRDSRRQVRHQWDDDDHVRQHDKLWESSFKVEIPEFHGGSRGEALLDCIATVDELLEFKQVPEERRVPLVAMRFRGHAASWWKQVKTTRHRLGKPPIVSWPLLPLTSKAGSARNYERTVYNKLQNLRQGSRTVDEYADEFSLLLTRTDIYDSAEQLVSRFIGGLRPQLQTALAQFDPTTIAEAHRRAASFEQTQRSSPWTNQSSRSRTSEQKTTPTTTKEGDAQPQTTGQPEDPNLRRSTRPPALKCYTCGEPGHRQSACPNKNRRGLVLDTAKDDLQPIYDSYDDDDEDKAEDEVLPTTGDTGHLLVLQRSCAVPRRQDTQWLRTNIFRSTCTIRDRVCTFIIDSGSSKNVITDDAVNKLGLIREQHPEPYTLGWITESSCLRVTQRVLVPFSIGPYYRERT